jgi:hypothetical protein
VVLRLTMIDGLLSGAVVSKLSGRSAAPADKLGSTRPASGHLKEPLGAPAYPRLGTARVSLAAC